MFDGKKLKAVALFVCSAFVFGAASLPVNFAQARANTYDRATYEIIPDRNVHKDKKYRKQLEKERRERERLEKERRERERKEREKRERERNKKYSAGDRNTAAIAGALAGYMIGRATK